MSKDDLHMAVHEALARAEKAEKERDEWRQACLAHGERADRAERQRDEAIAASDAGAEAMREACAQKAYEFGAAFRTRNQSDYAQGYEAASDTISTAIRRLPIPAQEGK